MSDFFGWMSVVVIVGMAPVLLVSGLSHVLSRKPVEEKYQGVTGGGLTGGALTGFDAAFSPTSHEAGIERDRQTSRTAPAPVAGDPPWTIGEGRITIDV